MSATSAQSRKIAVRLAAVLRQIPYPASGSGTQSASAWGYVSYAHDMLTLHKHVHSVLTYLAIPPRTGWRKQWGADDDEQRDEALRNLDRLEAWIEWRKRADFSEERFVEPYEPAPWGDANGQ